MLKQSSIFAYATLVKAERFILAESDRQNEQQLLVPEEYTVAVAEYLVSREPT